MSHAEGEKISVAALVRDLLFASKITAAGKAIGVSARIVRDPSQLAQLHATRLLVDLNQPGALEAAVAWKARTGGEVIGFVSHVDAATIARARDAGLDQVLARSRFVQHLPRLLGRSG